jgi:hypothetical protein
MESKPEFTTRSVESLSPIPAVKTAETGPVGAASYDTRMTVAGKTAKMLRKLLERVKGIEPSFL